MPPVLGPSLLAISPANARDLEEVVLDIGVAKAYLLAKVADKSLLLVTSVAHSRSQPSRVGAKKHLTALAPREGHLSAQDASLTNRLASLPNGRPMPNGEGSTRLSVFPSSFDRQILRRLDASRSPAEGSSHEEIPAGSSNRRHSDSAQS